MPVRLEGHCSQQVSQIQALWQQLFVLRKRDAPVQVPTISLQFKTEEQFLDQSSEGQIVFETPSLRILKRKSGFHLNCGASTLDLDLSHSQGTGLLDEGFWRYPQADQREFFLLSFLMLLRPHGLFGLHANGVVKENVGCLIVGNSGQGKTTLTLGLIQAGWRYLSDDALMLRNTLDYVEALAFRRGFSCTRDTANFFPELKGATDALFSANDKKLVDIEALYPDGFTNYCQPRMLVFPRIIGAAHTQLIPMDETQAITALIQQSPGIMVERMTVKQQLATLNQLVQQSCSYQILMGADVYQTPEAVSDLLWSAQKG